MPADRGSALGIFRSSAGATWVPVLLYHRVVPTLPPNDPYRNCVTVEAFDRQMSWLHRRGYQSIPLAALERRFEGRPAEGSDAVRRPVIVTFDDGYQDTFRFAWPVLQRYGFTATVFVVTDALGGDNSFDSPGDTERAPMLTADELRILQAQGMDIGSHTCSHPGPLTLLGDAALEAELMRSRQTLEHLLNAPVRHFAYPHSQVERRVELAVQRAGYTLACAGVGVRWTPMCVTRVDPATGHGATIEWRMHWRRLKWLLRSSSGLPARRASL